MVNIKKAPFVIGKYKKNLYLIQGHIYIPEFYSLDGIYSDTVITDIRFKSSLVSNHYLSNYIDPYTNVRFEGFVVNYPFDRQLEIHFRFTKISDDVPYVKVNQIWYYGNNKIPVNRSYPTDGTWFVVYHNYSKEYHFNFGDKLEMDIEIDVFAIYGLPVIKYQIPIFVTTLAYRDLIDTDSAYEQYTNKVKVYRDFIVRAAYIKFFGIKSEDVDTSNYYIYEYSQPNDIVACHRFYRPLYLEEKQEPVETNNYDTLPIFRQVTCLSIQNWLTTGNS